jgi:hypothetical protein
MPFKILVAIPLAFCFFQEPQEIKPYRPVVIRAITWKKGKPALSRLEILKVNLCEYDFLLREKEVRQELEIVAVQAQQLDDILYELSRLSNRIRIQWHGRRPSSNDKELLKLNDYRAEIATNLEEVLLPDQYERLREIQHRLLMRNVGVVKFLENMGPSIGLEKPGKAIVAVNVALKEIASEIQDELGNEVEESTDKILKPLTFAQRQRLDEFLDGKNTPRDLDIYLAQLKYLDNNKFEIGISTEALFEQMLDSVPFFRISFDGRFLAQGAGNNPIQLPQLILELSEGGANPLELTEVQRQVLADAHAEYWSNVRSLQAVRREQSRETGIVTERQNEDYNLQMQHVAENLCAACDGMLNHEQRKLVRIVCSSDLLPKYGLVANILRGDLGRDLDLTDSQRKEMKSILESEIQRIEDRLLYWDERIVEAAEGALDAEERENFAAAIGQRMAHVVPTLRMLVATNESGKN